MRVVSGRQQPAAKVTSRLEELANLLEFDIAFAFATAFYALDVRYYTTGIGINALRPFLLCKVRCGRGSGDRSINKFFGEVEFVFRCRGCNRFSIQ